VFRTNFSLGEKVLLEEYKDDIKLKFRTFSTPYSNSREPGKNIKTGRIFTPVTGV
jgi:hypothetical protein